MGPQEKPVPVSEIPDLNKSQDNDNGRNSDVYTGPKSSIYLWPV
jgi:hypothetical protein